MACVLALNALSAAEGDGGGRRLPRWRWRRRRPPCPSVGEAKQQQKQHVCVLSWLVPSRRLRATATVTVAALLSVSRCRHPLVRCGERGEAASATHAVTARRTCGEARKPLWRSRRRRCAISGGPLAAPAAQTSTGLVHAARRARARGAVLVYAFLLVHHALKVVLQPLRTFRRSRALRGLRGRCVEHTALIQRESVRRTSRCKARASGRRLRALGTLLVSEVLLE